jgi:hypothetical protein
MRRREFITLVVLSGEEKKAWAAGCDDYVPNPSVHHNCWRKFAFPWNQFVLIRVPQAILAMPTQPTRQLERRLQHNHKSSQNFIATLRVVSNSKAVSRFQDIYRKLVWTASLTNACCPTDRNS